MAFFIHIIVSTLKTGHTLFRILFFGLGILWIPFVIFECPKIGKIIFSLFPHIAQIENFQIIYLLEYFDEFKFRYLFSKYHKISFAESLNVFNIRYYNIYFWRIFSIKI